MMAGLAFPIIEADEVVERGARSPFPSRTRGKFIKQFSGPGEDSGVVCFKFWQLSHASGCPFQCAYCFLQTTAYFRFNKAALMGQIYPDYAQMIGEVERWLESPTPRMLIVGELQDGLAFDSAYAAKTGKALTHHLIPLFAAQDRHRLIFLTKSTLIRHALKLKASPQVVFSWSVNSEYAAKKWEIGAPPPRRRFEAAARLSAEGWPIRFRLDPMVPYEDGGDTWRQGYAEAVDRIKAMPTEMVTIGALRASSRGGLTAAAAKNDRPTDLFAYLSEKDPSGFKYRVPFADQVAMYRFVIDRLEGSPITPALCKEDVSVWNALGLSFRGCHCLLNGPAVADELEPGVGYRGALVL